MFEVTASDRWRNGYEENLLAELNHTQSTHRELLASVATVITPQLLLLTVARTD